MQVLNLKHIQFTTKSFPGHFLSWFYLPPLLDSVYHISMFQMCKPSSYMFRDHQANLFYITDSYSSSPFTQCTI